MSDPKYAPREVFEQILEWAAIPTFDLLLEIEDTGYILVKRKIAPYQNQWALPGLRMFKGESIEDVLLRIGKNEVGLDITPYLASKEIIGQFVGLFKTEHERQDISTGYHIVLPKSTEVNINSDHFSQYRISYDIPKPVGAMYKYYIETQKNGG